MEFEIIIAIICLCLFLTLLFSYICYRILFYSSPKKRVKPNGEYSLQQGETYKPYHEKMIEFIKNARSTPHKNVEVKSFDGLTLRGRYYQFSETAPIEIIFHGYRGDSESDLSGAVERCFSLEHSLLLVDHRAGGKSDGKTISFGVKECKDCLPWINFIIENINKQAKIFLCGISMGAATILNASQFDLGSNVVGIMADCGYTSPREIICKVMKEDMHLPPKLIFPFIKLGALIFGKFNIDKITPIESVTKSKYPILFIHGDNDKYVPYEMSVKNYNACITKKQFATIEKAGHGLAYITDPEKYKKEMKSFCDSVLNEN